MRRNPPYASVLLILSSALMGSFGDAIIRLGSANFSIWQLFLLRGLVATSLLFCIVRWLFPATPFRPAAFSWVCLRCMLMVAMWIAYYSALPFMSLSVAATGLYTTPLFIALFSGLFIGEAVGPRKWAGIALGFAGVIVILRPTAEDFSAVLLLPIVAAVFYALSATITQCKCHEEEPVALAMCLNLCLLITGALGVALLTAFPNSSGITFEFLQKPWAEMNRQSWLVIAILGIVFAAETVVLGKAYQLGPATIVGACDYSYLIFAAIWGFVIFSEVPDTVTCAGIAIILLSGYFVIHTPRQAAATR